MDFLLDGSRMWSGVLLVVLLWDLPALLLNGQTGSEAYREHYDAHPLRVGGLTALLVCHLTKRPRWLMERFDPISGLGQAISGFASASSSWFAAGHPAS